MKIELIELVFGRHIWERHDWMGGDNVRWFVVN